MITVRHAADRGHADHGWLESFHTFSFANYLDPAHMGFGNLRVINEDRVAAGMGFGTHSHRDMEIVSYVLDGELAHEDSMGNGTAGGANEGIIRPGDLQRMTAGTGVRHSEFNHSKNGTTHFLQIWILPKARNLAPSYEQKNFDAASKRGTLRLVASPTGADGSVTLNADASIRAGLFDGDEVVEMPLDSRRLAFVQVLRGDIEVNGKTLHAGDAAKIADESRLTLRNGIDSEVLVFDLAA
jgi:redox-sensitive bicupin YhaK (pirin superfamily)